MGFAKGMYLRLTLEEEQYRLNSGLSGLSEVNRKDDIVGSAGDIT